MPTPQGQRLTESHRLAQVRLGATSVAAVRAVWPLLNVEDIDASVEQWLRAVTVIVNGQRVISSRLAANYLDAYKSVELGERAQPTRPILAEVVPPDRLATSLIVTGAASVKSAIGRGVRPESAMATAEARSAAAAMRHVLNGGRETITKTIAADAQAVGWQRVTSGNSCDFCSMLAGRGAVYKTQTAQFQAHDGCGCTAAPVYRQ